MPNLGKTFRVFLSSTFKDFQIERNMVQSIITPALKSLCEEHGCRFELLDLRWGISNEATLNQKTAEMCLTEIKRCQKVTPYPNFIFLLGDRYGFVPLPTVLTRAEYEAILCGGLSDDESACLSLWYALDPYDDPAVYRLKPRTGHYVDADLWDVAYRCLNGLFARMVPERTSKDWQKYGTSLTHQELIEGVFQSDTPKDKIYGYVRTIDGLPVDSSAGEFRDFREDESIDTTAAQQIAHLKAKLKGLIPGGNFHDANHVPWEPFKKEVLIQKYLLGLFKLICFDLERSPLTSLTADEYRGLIETKILQYQHWPLTDTASGSEFPEDFDHRAVVDTVRSMLRTAAPFGKAPADQADLIAGVISLHHQLLLSRLTRARDPVQAYLRTLIDTILEDLKKSISEEIEKFEASDPLRRELEAQQAHAKELRTSFYGRIPFVGELGRYLDSTPDSLFFLEAAPGFGKSALVAALLDSFRGRLDGKTLAFRFLGLTFESTDPELMLNSLIEELKTDLSLPIPKPANYADSIDRFNDAVSMVGEKTGLVLILDGLDRLTDSYEKPRFAWLRANWPANVWVIITSSHQTVPDYIAKYIRPDSSIKWSALTSDGITSIIDDYLDRNRKRCVGDRAELEEFFRAHAKNPLYVVSALELLISGDVPFEDLSQYETLAGIILRKIAVFANPLYHGQPFVDASLGYLTASRFGLQEDELIDLLSRDGEVMADFRNRNNRQPSTQLLGKVPLALWSRLFFDLHFLSSEKTHEGQRLISIINSEIKAILEESYFSGDALKSYHRKIAAYFREKPDVVVVREPLPNRRKLVELPYQLLSGEDWSSLEDVLTDFDFIHAKSAAGYVSDLIQDYRQAEVQWPHRPFRDDPLHAPVILPPNVHEMKNLIFQHGEVLQSHPSLLYPLAYNSCSQGFVPREAERRVSEDQWRQNPWIRLAERNESSRFPACIRIIKAHRRMITGLAIADDEGLLFSAGHDDTLKIWNSLTGHSIRTIRCGQRGVTDLAITPDGKRCVTVGNDGRVKLWDSETGKCLVSLEGHHGRLYGVAMNRNGTVICSGGADRKIIVWHILSPTRIESFKLFGHDGKISCLCLSPLEDLLLTGDGNHDVLKVWNLRTRQLLKTVSLDHGHVQSIFIDRSGSRFGVCTGVRLSDSGWGGAFEHSAIMIWDWPAFYSRFELRVVGQFNNFPRYLRGGRAGAQGNVVHDLAITQDGNHAISVGFEPVIYVWELGGKLEHPAKIFSGHSDIVLRVALEPQRNTFATAGFDGTIRIWNLRGDSLQSSDEQFRNYFRVRSAGRGIPLSAKTCPQFGNLMYDNQRIRQRVLLPFLIGLTSVLGYPILYETVIRRAYEFPTVLLHLPALAVLYGLLRAVHSVVSVNAGYKSDPSHFFTKDTSALLNMFKRVTAFPLKSFFKGYYCPMCGYFIVGRKGLFHCPRCEWREERTKRSFEQIEGWWLARLLGLVFRPKAR